MKTKFYSLFLLTGLILINMNTYAKCWRVNNNTDPAYGIHADFTQVYYALNSSNVHNGDTLYIEPSTSGYSGFSCTKKLVIIGPGYFLDQKPETQVHNWLANVMSGMSFETGSEGSKIMGISFYGNYSGYNINTNNITVQRCYFGNNNDYINIRGALTNIIENYIVANIVGDQSYNPGIVIKNNIITGNISLNNNYNGAIMNNVIGGNLNESNFAVQNNIMTNISATFGSDTTNCINNMGAGTQFGTNHNNKSNVNMSTVFVCWGSCSGYSPDSIYMLKAGSPAHGTGVGGVDMGAFGGLNPYVLLGMPNVPAIYQYDIFNDQQNVNIHIKAKSH